MLCLNRTLATLAPFLLLLTSPVKAQTPNYWILPQFHVGVSGQRTVMGTVVSVVGPVIVKKQPVTMQATATYEDSWGNTYQSVSNELTINLPVYEAWLSFYENGYFTHTVKLTSNFAR